MIIDLSRIDDFILQINHYDLDDEISGTENVFFEKDILKRLSKIKQDYQPIEVDEDLKEQLEDYFYEDYMFDFPEVSLYFKKEDLVVYYDESFWYYDLKTKTVYEREYYSNDDIYYRIIQLKNECEVLKTIDNTLQKQLVACASIDLDEEDTKPKYEAQYTKEFPFFGAGNASYFEAYSLMILFKTAPSKEMKTKIIKLLPESLNADIEDFNGCILSVYMEYGYDYFNEYNNFDEYNTDLEKALLFIHKFQPIVFAYRIEDTEAAGTVFSKWHKDSKPIDTVEKIEQGIDAFDNKEINELKDYLIEIFSMYGLDDKANNIFRKPLWCPKNKS